MKNEHTSAPHFDYLQAFSRNLGWVTVEEQLQLRGKRVAIAGLGGVGGSHLLSLTRLGIGNFTLAEMDVFELANFNRQVGATCSSIGRPKLDVMHEKARDINPELDIRSFPDGINDANLDDFLTGVDLYVDSLDFFAFAARRAIFAACARRNIPAITAAPLGMGVALLCFAPHGMSFENYFRLNGHSEWEQSLRLLIGLAPAHLQAAYVRDHTRIDLAARTGPSTVMGCELCAGVAATEALKILLRRGNVTWAPRGLQFDAYRHKLSRTYLPWGNANPLQQLRLAIARRMLTKRPASHPRTTSRALAQN